MTADTAVSRIDSTACPCDEQGLSEASRVALAIKDRWRAGETPDVARTLESHPELRRYRSVVLDLACQEFRLRVQAGEELDAEAFSQRFPSLQKSLYFLVGAHYQLSLDPDFQALQNLLPWPQSGDHFLQFNLIAEIGRGTFGRVFLATEPSLGNRRIVVKIAPHGVEEAEILGRLRHPNIVPIYSLQEDDVTGLAAFCMPYLGRATLSDVLDHVFVGSHPPNRARPILDAVEVVDDIVDSSESSRPDLLLREGSYVDGVVHLGVQLAEALAHSHGRGICHRDLKPSNVLMTPEGRPLLLDFNLSVDGGVLTGRVGGTVPYMAPEELTTLFEKVNVSQQRYYDPRSDLFSLGVIIYELLTGTLPFGAISWDLSVKELAFQICDRQKTGPTPVRERNGQVDVRLARLIESCLAFEPEQRPETVRDFAVALRRELAPVRRVIRWMGNHVKLVASTSASACGLIAAIALFFALRPPYSVRQLEQGLDYSEQGQYALAVDSLSNSLRADPSSGEALFARGRANQCLGKFQTAIQDYNSAYRLTSRPLLKACEGYCLSRIKSHMAAIAAYRLALDTGYDSPAMLYNNIGFGYLMLRRIDDAEKCLQRAIRLDGNLQAAHYNMVMIFLQRALHQGKPIPDNTFIHARRAIEIGPPSAELYQGLAAVYATAATRDSGLIGPAIEYVGKAVELGFKPEAFASDIRYSVLRKEPAFCDALKRSGSASSPPKAIQLIDPLDKP
jgi:eukaryotic-like serine/threonine-protein kinase